MKVGLPHRYKSYFFPIFHDSSQCFILKRVWLDCFFLKSVITSNICFSLRSPGFTLLFLQKLLPSAPGAGLIFSGVYRNFNDKERCLQYKRIANFPIECPDLIIDGILMTDDPLLTCLPGPDRSAYVPDPEVEMELAMDIKDGGGGF